MTHYRFLPNKVLGKYEIRVTASYAGRHAETKVMLSNVGHRSHAGTKVLVAVIVVLAVGAVLGLLLGTRHIGPTH